MATVSIAHHAREKRQHPRVKAAIQAELRQEASEWVPDISPGGFYVEMMMTLEVGCRLEVVLWLPTGRLAVHAVVVTKYPQVGNGIKFLDLKPEDRRRLEDLLLTLATDAGAPQPA
jgi:hypothetical protein